MTTSQEFAPVSRYEERLAEHHRATGNGFMRAGGAIWSVYQRMIVPEGPVCRDYTISPIQQQTLLSHFRKALLVRYTDGFHAPAEDSPPWYAVTCSRFLDLGDYTSHFRSMIRRGLKNCVVSKVDAEYVAAHGYDVYMAAYAQYKGATVPSISRDEWKRRMLINTDYPDLRNYWAVLVDKQLAAYSENIIFDTTEAAYSTVKCHPAFLKAYPSYALFFKMNEYYLRERSFAYVSDGFRSIRHNTNVQDFLIQKFGFQRTATNLYVRYRPWVSAAMSIPRFAKRWLGTLVPQYASLCALDEARRRTKS